jgi:glycosyltransferase involved in cell wall biosynthesis
MLSKFYTDICGNVGLGWLSVVGAPFSAELRRLAGREVPSPVAARTRAFPLRTALHECRGRLSRQSSSQRLRANLRWQSDLGRAAGRSGFGNATHFFSLLAEFPTLVISAKEHGLQTVSEVYILLSTERILAEERKAFPGWDCDSEDFDRIRRELFANDVLLTKTDHFICPSDAVRDDLILNRGIAPQSAVLIPYGMDPRLLEHFPNPQRARVLFVGTADLRKGIHYLAMASQKLAAYNSRLEFRVAGGVPPSVVRQPICRHLNFLGRVPRNLIYKEFQAADVFVLPSLAEGSAEATYEALAAGLPVITTKSAGSVVRDGIEGRIVAERDPDALAAAIQELTEDRSLRNRMAVAARKRAKDFTWDRYGERLLAYLRSLPQ